MWVSGFKASDRGWGCMGGGWNRKWKLLCYEGCMVQRSVGFSQGEWRSSIRIRFRV